MFSDTDSKAQDIRLLNLAVQFTEAYQASADMPKAQRELHLIQGLYPDLLLPPLEDDRFAGRALRPISGFSNQAFPEGDQADTVGFFFDEVRANRLIREHNLHDTELGQQIRACADYWRSECTDSKIVARMDAPMHQALPSLLFEIDSAVSHRLHRIASTGLDYAYLLDNGIPALKQQFADQAEQLKDSDPAGEDFRHGCVAFMELLDRVLAHYAQTLGEATAATENLTRRHALNTMATSVAALRQRPPQTFFEAIQLVHLFTLVGLYCNNFGRMDEYLGPYLQRDLNAGRITQEQATEMLVAYWWLLNEHYNNSRMTLGGIGRRNPEAADTFCRVALEATRRFYAKHTPRTRHMGFALCPQVALRISSETPADIRAQALAVQATGATYPLMYNDDVNVPAVAKAFRISEKLAAEYGGFDCGEYVMDKYSIGTPSAIIALPKALEVALHNGIDPRTGKQLGPATGNVESLDSFDKLWQAYDQQVTFATEQSARFQKLLFDVVSEHAAFVAMSMLQPDSRATHRGILEGGSSMLGGTYETYGNITAADCLFAIRKFVFEEHNISLADLVPHLDNNFKDAPELKQQLKALPKFGNDHDEADAMAIRVHDHICNLTRDQADKVGLHHYLVVVINNGANVILGHHANASADARGNGEPFSNGNTPSSGNDTHGLTAMLNSIVKLTPDTHAGAVHNIRFSKKTIDEHRPMVTALLDTYFSQGGTQYMLTVTSREELLEAQAHPENYGHLLVRVGGFSSRFVELPADIQQEIINRNAY